jgi:hypothetical protein
MKNLNIPPIALSATLTTNLLNCAVTSMSGPVGMTVGQPYLEITQIRFVNKDTSARTISLWKGATGANTAGTEVVGQALSIPASQAYDVFLDDMRMDSTDFLVGGADVANKVTMQVLAKIGISG